MKEKYEIKGIEKVISVAGKERLARYYGVDIDADFEKVITEDFKRNDIPNGLEVALYFSLTPDEYNKYIEEKREIPIEQDAAIEVYEQDGKKRAMFGFNYMDQMLSYDKNMRKIVDGTWGNVLYFFVDEPIKLEEVGKNIYKPKYLIGGVKYQTLYMGNGYYENHKDELSDKEIETAIQAVDDYIENFMNEYHDVEYTGGYGPRESYIETDEIRTEKIKNEKIILDLTGKCSIDELNLKDYIELKRRLEKEQQELLREFEEKNTKKSEEDKGVR